MKIGDKNLFLFAVSPGVKVLKIKTFFMYVCFDGALLHGCISQDVVRRPVLEATSLSFFANHRTIPNFP